MGYVAYNNPHYSYHVVTIQILSQDVNKLSILPSEFPGIQLIISPMLFSKKGFSPQSREIELTYQACENRINPGFDVGDKLGTCGATEPA